MGFDFEVEGMGLYAEDLGDEAVELTQEMVRIDSSDPGAYEGEIGDFIERWLKGHAPGVFVERGEVVDGRENLCAVLEGKAEHPALIFICHMDTVTLGEGWERSTPLSGEIMDGKLYGRGACDMKSGLACAMSVFAACAKKAEKLGIPGRTMKLIATVDEEDFMRGAEHAISSGWVSAEDWVLDMEPTDGKIEVAHKGRAWFELSVEGITAHASTPHKGADAIAGISEMICEIRRAIQDAPVHHELGNSTVTFGMIEGGYRPYVVPDKAKVWIDMRLVPPLTTARAEEIVRKAMEAGEERVPGVHASYVITGNRPFIEKDESSLLLNHLCWAVEKVTNAAAVVDIFPGYTDTAVIAGVLENHNCMSYGPGSLELAHKPDEHVEVKEIYRCCAVLQSLADDILFKSIDDILIKRN